MQWNDFSSRTYKDAEDEPDEKAEEVEDEIIESEESEEEDVAEDFEDEDIEYIKRLGGTGFLSGVHERLVQMLLNILNLFLLNSCE